MEWKLAVGVFFLCGWCPPGCSRYCTTLLRLEQLSNYIPFIFTTSQGPTDIPSRVRSYYRANPCNMTSVASHSILDQNSSAVDVRDTLGAVLLGGVAAVLYAFIFADNFLALTFPLCLSSKFFWDCNYASFGLLADVSDGQACPSSLSTSINHHVSKLFRSVLESRSLLLGKHIKFAIFVIIVNSSIRLQVLRSATLCIDMSCYMGFSDWRLRGFFESKYRPLVSSFRRSHTIIYLISSWRD